jgi:hypothetical protein
MIVRRASALLKCFALATFAALVCFGAHAADVQIKGGVIEINGNVIEFDGDGLFEFDGADGVAQPAKKPVASEAEPAGNQLLELTDGSQLHGTLVAMGKNELVWQRADANQPLVFSPGDVRRLTLGKRVPAKKVAANATLKLAGGDWLVGKVNAFVNDRFAVDLGGGPSLEVEKKFVEWAVFDPLPPDAYDGPRGPTGLAGWETAISGAWSCSDDALIAKQSSAITRRFDVLSERIDIQFAAGDGGNQNRGLTLWIQPEGRTTGYSVGSVYLRFQGNSVSMNSYDGNAMKNQSVNFEQDNGKADRISRYRLLYDSKEGTLQVRVNGVRAAEWKVGVPKTPARVSSLTFQPSYWSSDMAWTLSGVKVQPWDGEAVPDGDPDDAGKDIIKADPTIRKAGAFEGLTADAVKFSGAEVSRKEPVFLRFGRKPASSESAAIARVWLAQRGEFDVTALGFKDGVLKVRTPFAGDIALPVAAIHAIEFPHKMGIIDQENAAVTDSLIFKNGDRFRGSLLSAAHDQGVKWKSVKGGEVEFESKLVAGVQLARRKDANPPAPGDVAVRWQNGDWLTGSLLAYENERLVLKTALAERMEIPREGLAALYVGASGEAPVWDGASGRDVWMEGAVAPGYWNANRALKDKGATPGPWKHFDGAFTLAQAGRSGSSSGPNIGRIIENLPDKCEVSFDVSPAAQTSFVAHFFFDDNKPGIMVQASGSFAYLYDMSPRAARAIGNQQQQIELGDSINGEGNSRRYTFYGERSTGRFYMAVNGKLVGQLNRKGGGDSPKPGRGISIAPQAGNSSPTISNLWVAPWSGSLPPAAGKPKVAPNRGLAIPGLEGFVAPPRVVEVNGRRAVNILGVPITPAIEPPEKKAELPPESAEPEVPLDAIALINGDETRGILKRATADALFVECEVGELEIPARRATMIEFAPKPAGAAAGARFRLAGKGAITAENFRFENGRVVCHSTSAGTFEIPVAALSEIIFAPGSRSPFAAPPVEKNPASGIFDGARQILLDGGNIIIRGAIRAP